MRLAVTGGGAAIGGVVGGIVGGPAGAVFGAQIGFAGGALLAGILFPAKSDATQPARDDVRLSSSALGRAIPVPLVGSVQPGGQYIWVEEEPTYVTKTEQAGKGGGPEVETVETFFSFVCGLCEGPVCAVTRLWFDDTLVFDISDKNPDGPALSQLLFTGEVAGITLSDGVQSVGSQQFGPIRIYLGTEDQPQDPLLLADERIGTAFGGDTADYVPPMAGLCYVACQRVPGKATNGHYPQMKAEVLTSCEGFGDGVLYSPTTKVGNDRRNIRGDHATYVAGGGADLNDSIHTWNVIDKNPTDPIVIPFVPVSAQFNDEVLTPWNVGTWDDPDLLALAVGGAGNLQIETFEMTTGAQISPQRLVTNGAGASQSISAAYYYPDTLNPTRFIVATQIPDEIFSFPSSWDSDTDVNAFMTYRPGPIAVPGTSIDSISFEHSPGFIGPDGLLYLSVGESSSSNWAIVAFDPITLEVRRALEPYTASPASSDRFYSQFFITYDRITDKIICVGGTGGYLRRVDRETLTVDPLDDLATGGLQLGSSTDSLVHGPIYGVLWLQRGSGNFKDFDVWNWAEGPCGAIDADDYGLFSGGQPTFDPINQGLWMQGGPTFKLGFIPLCRKSPLCGTAKDIADAVSNRVGVPVADRITTAWAAKTICGYMTGQRVSGRDALNPIMGWIDGDYRMNDGQVEFILLDTPAVKTIEQDDLGAAETLDAKVPQRDIYWPYERTLPQRVEATVLSRDHAYNPLPVGMDRPINGFAGRTKETLQFPIVVDDDSDPQPIEVVERILYQRDIRRRTHRTALTWKHIDLLPGDAFDYVRDGVTYSVRAEKVAVGETNKVLVESVRDDVTVLTASGAAGAGAPAIHADPDLTTGAALQLFMLDGPLLRDQDDAVSGIPVYAGVAGEHNGAALYRSDDNGATWKVVGTFSSGQQIDWGVATTALADGPSTVLDTDNEVTLDMRRGVLSSASAADLNADPEVNALLLGRSGRWEALRFQTVVDETGSPAGSGDTFTISDLRRGRRCSEVNTGTHQAGDLAFLLDPADYIRLDLPQSELGVTRLYKAVAFGAPEALASPVSFTLAGIAKKPCAVSQLDATWDASGNITVSWNRRDRLGGAWPPQVATVLSEAYERYTIRFIDTGTSPETVIVSATVEDAQSYEYTALQQIEDFGGVFASVTIEVVQLSAVVGEGNIARETFVADDPALFAAVVLLSRMDADPPVDLSDSAHTFVDGGAGATTDTTNQKFGSGCRDYDGSSTGYDEIADSGDWYFGDRDFTVEGWFRWNATGANMYLVCQWGPSADERGWGLYFQSGNQVQFHYSTDGSDTVQVLVAAFTPTLGQWYHIAVSRRSGTIYLFVDGEELDSAANSATYFDSPAVLRIGNNADGTVEFEGKVDELRITRGAGRYVSDFTPPDSEFPTA